jgi:hypothetical protein
MATKKAKTSSPRVTKGSHLTVYEDENGKTTLEWDYEQLVKDVREAISNYELSQLKPAVKAKAVTRKKKTTDN